MTNKQFNQVEEGLKRIRKTYAAQLGMMVTVAACLAGANMLAQAAPAAQKPTNQVSKPAASAEQGNEEHPNLSSDVLAPKALEDWTTPSLSGSHLVASEPIESDDAESGDPAYTLDLVRVGWRPSDPIDLYIMKPAGVSKPPVILYLYSYPFDNDRYLKNDFRKFLTKNGFAAVGFVSALTGQRYHAPRPMKEWFVSQLQESLATSAHDVQMVLNYLASRGDLDMNRVGMFGEGSGASIAILAAAVDPRIKTLDLVNPWGDWPDWMAKSTLIPEHERADYLKPEFLAGVAPLDPVEWLPKLKTQKIRLTEVNSVTVTPTEARKRLEAAVRPNVGIQHFDDTKAFLGSIAGGAAFDWLKQQMRSAGPVEYHAAQQASGKSTQN